MFNWFFNPRPIELPKLSKQDDYMWTVETTTPSSFQMDKLSVTAGTDGSISTEYSFLLFRVILDTTS